MDAFSASTNEIINDANETMSTAKILALFNTPSTSTMNIRTGSIQTSDRMDSVLIANHHVVFPSILDSSPGFTQHFSSFVPPKSLSFSNNLSQQATFFPAQSQVHSTFGMNHHTNRSNATSTFTPEQVTELTSSLLYIYLF